MTTEFETVGEILARFERPMTKAETRDAYYAAEDRKAEARRARDLETFRFYEKRARELLAALNA